MKDNKIKIVYVMPSLDAGGAERFILDLIENLDLNLFSPTLILFDHGGFFVEELKNYNIDLIILKKKFKFDLVNFFKLCWEIKKNRPQIVHTQLGGDIYGRLAAWILRVPIIVSTDKMFKGKNLF